MPMIFVNLPVTDLERSKAFYTAVGFPVNPAFTDENAACIVVEEDHSCIMILTRPFFQSFTDQPLGDPSAAVSALTSVNLDSREAVDAAVAGGLGAGGTEARPAADYGFMYQRQLTDPDGNIFEIGHMDPAFAASGPEGADAVG
ncbi:VOC family protein [Clavibacter zhangzhiyongii]|uniref:VOC family protein n=1 Tax=Clavibacter zhangzhiyongii TaxID=2768071 RepID=UPI0039DFC5D9